MKKFIDFCKKPLLITSSCLFFAFMVVLIVVCAVPHGKHYTAVQKLEMETGGVQINTNLQMKYEVTFLKDKKVTVKNSTLMDGKVVTAKQMFPTLTDEQLRAMGMDPDKPVVQEMNGTYRIDKGILYITLDPVEGMDIETDEMPLGKINSLKLVLDENPQSETEKLVLKCKTNVALEVTSIVFMSIAAVLVAASATLIVLDKKGILSKKEEQKEVA